MVLDYSIIIPYHDKYDLFVKATESIPDREDIQLIIVDNAPHPLSRDRIPTKNHADVVYTRSSPTKGAGCARNKGLEYVRGRYLLFLDADDFFTNNAFDCFDKYLEKDYDIVYFKCSSVRLDDGSLSDRHLTYERLLDGWLNNHEDLRIRYCWNVPWAKLYRTEFVKKGNFQFEEILVHNDAWFSTVTGHSAKKIFGDNSCVYVVTEGSTNQSLVKTVNRETAFIRYCARIRVNNYLKSIDRYDMHIRLLGSLKLALTKFGLKEFWRYLKYAKENGVGIF